MIIEEYILGQSQPFTIHSLLNEMIDDGLVDIDFEILTQKVDYLRWQFRILAVGSTLFGEDVFKVVRL